MPAGSQKSEEIHVGLSWTEGLGKYKLTKVITLTPRFLIVNKLPDAISFREHGVAPRGRSTIEPDEKCPLQVMRTGDDKLLTFAYPGLNTKWSVPILEVLLSLNSLYRSPPINVEDIGTVSFRLPLAASDEQHLVNTDIKIEGSTIFVYLSRAADGWPFKIENRSSYRFTFTQTVSKSLQ